MNAASVAVPLGSGQRARLIDIGLAAARAIAIVFFSFCALLELVVTLPFLCRERRLGVQARWLHKWCRFACRILNINATCRGSVPASGLLVCNHLSYLDIIVLSSITPCVFVAKQDVAHWPLFGWLARAGGTIFVNRQTRLASTQAIQLVRAAVGKRLLVALFAEGTSSDGSTVLPFKSALIEPALQIGCNITAGAIDYSLESGSVADEVCYWRDMTLVPHLLNLLTRRLVHSYVQFACFLGARSNRKEIARALRQRIVAMRS